ncbi:MAG TPA: hypothetical protein VLC53_04630 [Myxococcota bacterium]|nr:hypothetical protein [Myxococcota bacterium]
MKRPFAIVLLVPFLFVAGGAAAGDEKRPPVEISVVSAPVGALSVDGLGAPIGGIVDIRDGLPPGATDSDSFEIPDGQVLILDQVGAFATFDRDLPAGARFPLFLTGGGVQMPIGFGEAIGNEIHVAIPLSIVLRGNFNFAILGDFGGAIVQFARYSFAGRLVPVQ